MANAVYPLGGTKILSATINFASGGDNFRVYLIDTGTYTYSAAHEFHSDLSGIVATSANLASQAVASGVFDAADNTISAVSGSTVEAIALAKWTGTSGTSPLLFYWDTGVTGLPLTPNGGDVTVQFNGSGIYSAV